MPTRAALSSPKEGERARKRKREKQQDEEEEETNGVKEKNKGKKYEQELLKKNVMKEVDELTPRLDPGFVKWGKDSY